MSMNLLTFPFSGYLYNAEQTRELDRLAIAQSDITGFALMQRAGLSLYQLIQREWPSATNIVIFCGCGNNGGDGLVLAALAKQDSLQPIVFMAGSREAVSQMQGEAREAYQLAVSAGVSIQYVQGNPDDVGTLAINEALNIECVNRVDLIVDALLGTGLKGDVRTDSQQVIRLINDSTVDVISVDVPSGVCSDSGKILGAAVKATKTLSFIGMKQGLMTHDGLALRGELFLDTLGIDEFVYQQVPSSISIIDSSLVYRSLPPRPVNSHKGSNGHLLVVAGGEGMAGAGLMASEAALHVGAGLVTLATLPEHVGAANVRCPEVMAIGIHDAKQLDALLTAADVLLVGPGLGQTAWAESMLQRVLRHAEAEGKPVLVDADALNLIARSSVQPQLSNRVMTPHPGEAARLLSCTTGEVQADRYTAVKKLQDLYGGTVMLKGAGSIVTDGKSTRLCQFGNPGMATGGMGDVLSGVIAGLAVQGLSLFDATAVGVQIHAQAADTEANQRGQRGLRATALFNHLGKLCNPHQCKVS